MKIALAMIVKGSDEEARLLNRCLGNISPYVDGVFITRTHLKGQEPNKEVEKVATRFGATLSDFEWCNDFSKARNFNFSQVPRDYDYIMWTDADDMWKGLEKLKSTIEEHKEVDAFGFWYLYDWDEFKLPTVVHRKTMIVKNDGCVTWAGALHEDLMENRTLDVQLVEGIRRLHLSNPERIAIAAQRNVAISTEEMKVNPDDPRSHWNLANSQFGAGDYAGATKTFNEFIERTHSDEEKYLAITRLADIQKSEGKFDDAVRNLQTAIGLAPSIPDAYLQLAHLYYTMQNYEKAEKYCLDGLVKRPQIGKLVVYNPRDYDYNPMMLLSQIYYHQNRPDLMVPLIQGCLRIYPDDVRLKRLHKEALRAKKDLGLALEAVERIRKIKDVAKIKKEIDKLPISIRSHPAIVVLYNRHFQKAESSGRDLVIYCGNTTHTWNPELFITKGFGGSEEAVIHMAEELTRLGWNVTVYNNCGHKALKADGVTYRPFWEWNYRDKQDVVILWRWVKPLDVDINAPKIFVDLHDVVSAGEFNESRLAKVDKIFVKSAFHRSLFPNVSDNKIVIIPNGFETYGAPTKKDPYLIINTSSPDRSMDVLPALFKEVKKRAPQARLQWAYGWDTYKSAHASDAKKMKWMTDTIKAMDDAGIEQLGKLPQHEVAKLYQKASILAYPTEFAEIDCISVKKAQAAHCWPVATDFGALEESIKFGTKIHSPKTATTWNKPYQFHFGIEGKKEQEQWVDAVVSALRQPQSMDGVEEWTTGFKWSNIAKRWNDVLHA